MRTHTHILVLAAFVLTTMFIGTYGAAYRAQVAHAECVGKIYGTPGCPLKGYSLTCGDGHVDAKEECDNGKGRNGMGNCSSECLFLACGDGIVSEDLGEECEPKRDEVYAIDPETGQLTTELRFMVASCGMTCEVPTCGDDGICFGGCKKHVQAACVTAVSSASADSSSVLFHAAAEESSAASTSAAAIPQCGNAVKDVGEQCDDGNNLDTDGCTIACKLPRCGDGVIQGSERCDDGNTMDTDGCTNYCQLPSCGDGIVQEAERCDNGGNNSDYLANACRSDCSIPRCGDHIVDNGEECDGGDACTTECVRIRSIGGLVAGTSAQGKVAMILATIGALLVLAFIFRAMVHRVVRRVAGEQVARSIDDIPLDEIEMPWVKW